MVKLFSHVRPFEGYRGRVARIFQTHVNLIEVHSKVEFVRRINFLET